MSKLGDLVDDKPPVHCGRLDPHPLHVVPGRRISATHYYPAIHCRGRLVTEGGAGCVLCGGPVANCTCYAELVAERGKEWYS